MSRTYKIMLTALLLVAITIIALRLLRSEERVINRRLDDLLAAISKSADEKPIASLTRTQSITAFFPPEPEIVIGSPLPALTTRQELVGAIHSVRSMSRSIVFKIHDRKTTVGGDRESATTALTLEGIVDYAGGTGREIREFDIAWVKTEGRWLIRKIALVSSIRKPGEQAPGL